MAIPLGRLDGCEPGDILVFDGKGFLARRIKHWTCSRHTHVAVVAHVTKDDLAAVPHKLEQWRFSLAQLVKWEARMVLFESTSILKRPCLFQGKLFAGTQAHDVAERVDDCPGRVWRLRLKWPITPTESRRLTRGLLTGIPKPYDTFGAGLSATLFLKHKLMALRASDRRTLYCCEYAVDQLEQAFDPRRGYRWANPGTLTPRGVVQWAEELYRPPVLIKEQQD